MIGVSKGMEASVEGEFLLEDFSPEALTFLPGLNCVLASNRNGEIRCIDVVNRQVHSCHGKNVLLFSFAGLFFVTLLWVYVVITGYWVSHFQYLWHLL